MDYFDPISLSLNSRWYLISKMLLTYLFHDYLISKLIVIFCIHKNNYDVK